MLEDKQLVECGQMAGPDLRSSWQPAPAWRSSSPEELGAGGMYRGFWSDQGVPLPPSSKTRLASPSKQDGCHLAFPFGYLCAMSQVCHLHEKSVFSLPVLLASCCQDHYQEAWCEYAQSISWRTKLWKGRGLQLFTSFLDHFNILHHTCLFIMK